MSIFTILFVILLIGWILGWGVFHVAGGLIHLLLIVEVLADLLEQRQRLTGDLADL